MVQEALRRAVRTDRVFVVAGTPERVRSVLPRGRVLAARAVLVLVPLAPLLLAPLAAARAQDAPGTSAKPAVARWTDEEARERWTRDAPPATHKKFETPIRTKHYIVLTDQPGPGNFVKHMEECYGRIRATYPFEEKADERLMPIFLFRTPDEYYDYYSKVAGIPREQARKSKGHAWRDYYATYYDEPKNPVHVHEATHQIFANRLGLHGGGSWLQEGVAEYMSSTENERNIVAQVVAKGRHTRLVEFVQMKSLLYSSQDDVSGDKASSLHYKQAALLIEFLRESKWGKTGFPKFLETVGKTKRGDLAEIEAAVESVYATDLAGLEKHWVDYCKKR